MNKGSTIKIEEAMRMATARFRDIQIPDPRRDASVLMAHLFPGDREIQYREPGTLLTNEQIKLYFEFVERRCNHEPVSHILEIREFWSRDFFVNKHVLDPRPDSETLIEAVLKSVQNKVEPIRILDLGTGSGCLLLTLIAEIENSTGVGVDLSRDALDVAKRNAESLGLTNRVQFIKSTWFEAVSAQFNIIVSNPPYIESDVIETLQEEVRNFEPRLALDGGQDGLNCYRAIIADLSPHLVEEGYVIFEVGEGQATVVSGLLSEARFNSVTVHHDLAKVGRCISGILG